VTLPFFVISSYLITSTPISYIDTFQRAVVLGFATKPKLIAQLLFKHLAMAAVNAGTCGIGGSGWRKSWLDTLMANVLPARPNGNSIETRSYT
jgi:hypothetical protein